MVHQWKMTAFLAVVAVSCSCFTISEAAVLAGAAADDKMTTSSNSDGPKKANLTKPVESKPEVTPEVNDVAKSGDATDFDKNDDVSPDVTDMSDVSRPNFDPRFVALIRSLVYKIELLAEEEYLRTEIQSMLDYPMGGQGLRGAKNEPIRVGLDGKGAVKVEAVADADADADADELLEQLKSLQLGAGQEATTKNEQKKKDTVV